MSKKYATSITLVIVESPAKCNKIEEYLGHGYKCIASFGHFRELSSLEDIDITTFQVKYQCMSSKKLQINNIRNAIKEASEVIIATDDDREGESIGWHLCDYFNLNINTVKRIIFHEITEKAIKEAIENPRKINMNVVYAQQARQILDLMVGFEISPILWKYIKTNKKPLSAGRCQTPALQLIMDNQIEINNNPGIEVYKINGLFEINHWNISFDLNKEIEKKEEVILFLKECMSFPFQLTCSSPVKKYISSPSPFTTSSLQQTCSNEMSISPKETMKICQTLYEKGYITYMRTESKNYSNEFIQKAHKYILEKWADNYINYEKTGNTTNTSSTIIENSQAHEAIRPTNIFLSCLEENNEITTKEKRIYQIIWQNTIESLMVSSSQYVIKAKINVNDTYSFIHTSEQIFFPGWKIVKKKDNGKKEKENKEYNYFLNIASSKNENCFVEYTKINAIVDIQQTKSFYTEAKLVHLLEEKGIGRPSTFASLVDKIQERDYVKKKDIKGKIVECLNYEIEKKEDKINNNIKEIVCNKEFGKEKGKLVIQPIGKLVVEFLKDHFHELFNYNFTSNMENELDDIANGNKDKIEICQNINNKILYLKNNIKMKDKEEENVNFKIDENHTYIIGKYGPVIKCIDKNGIISFKKIKKDFELDIHRLKEYTIDQIIENEKSENSKKDGIINNEMKIKNNSGFGIYQGFPLIIKKGKFGLYASWGTNTKSLKCLGNRPINNIKKEEVMNILNI
jgi:DNA topoisomerase-1